MHIYGTQLAKRVKCSLFPFLSAKKQAEIQRNIDDLKREVDKRDLDIRILQKNLKEAENVLVSIEWQKEITIFVFC